MSGHSRASLAGAPDPPTKPLLSPASVSLTAKNPVLGKVRSSCMVPSTKKIAVSWAMSLPGRNSHSLALRPLPDNRTVFEAREWRYPFPPPCSRGEYWHLFSQAAGLIRDADGLVSGVSETGGPRAMCAANTFSGGAASGGGAGGVNQRAALLSTLVLLTDRTTRLGTSDEKRGRP